MGLEAEVNLEHPSIAPREEKQQRLFRTLALLVTLLELALYLPLFPHSSILCVSLSLFHIGPGTNERIRASPVNPEADPPWTGRSALCASQTSRTPPDLLTLALFSFPLSLPR